MDISLSAQLARLTYAEEIAGVGKRLIGIHRD